MHLNLDRLVAVVFKLKPSAGVAPSGWLFEKLNSQLRWGHADA
jgi:hypothetical protein